MKKIKKIALSLLCAFSCIGIGLSVMLLPKNAAAETSNDVFIMDQGASIKISGKNEREYGIRFSASLGTSYEEGTEYFMMIIPEDWLVTYSLDENSDFYDELVVKNQLNVAVMETYPIKDMKTYGDDDYHIRGSLTNIKYGNLNRDFFGIAYAQKAGVREYATYIDGQNVRNIGYVASAAINDTKEFSLFTEAQKNYVTTSLNNAYKQSQGLDEADNATLDTENITLSSSNITLQSGEKNDSIVLNGMPDNYAPQIIWESADESKVHVDANGKLTARAAGDTTVKAKVLGKECSLSVSVTMDIPEYYLENDYLDNVIASIPEGKSFIFVTDPHWKSNMKNSPALLQYVKEKAGIDNIVLGGDILDQEFSSADAEYEMSNYMEIMKGLFGTDVLPVLGNHDLNVAGIRAGVNEDKYELYHLDYSKVYEIMFSQLEGVVIADNANKFPKYKNFEELDAYMKMHYYYDDTENGIRYINVVTGNTYSGILKNDFSASNGSELILQYQWFYESLMSVPNGYDVVVTGHAPILYSKDNNIEGDQVGKYSLQLCKMLSALKTKGKATITNDVNNSNLNKFLSYGNTEFDFADANDVGSVLVLGGDMHWDNACITGYVGDEYTTRHAYENELFTQGDILVVATHADQLADYSKLPYGEKFAPMTEGTITDQCFDIVTLGADGKTYFTRVGVGESRTFEYGANSNYEKRVVPVLNTEDSYEVGIAVELNATVSGVENYTFTYFVTDPNGDPVEMNGNVFTPLSMGDYKVVAVLNCANALGEVEGTITVGSTNKIVLSEYNEPKVGDLFVLPSASLFNSSDALLSEDYEVEIKRNGSTVAMQESVTLYAGNTEIIYTFVYNGVTYVKTIEFTFNERAEMSKEMLEDFNDPSSISNVPEITGYDAITYTNYSAEWLETYEGRTGVAKVSTSNAGANNELKVGVRFNKTKEQLQAMDFGYITVKVYVDAEGTFKVGTYKYQFASIEGKAWQEIRLTKDIIRSSSPKSWYYQNTGAGKDPYDKFCDYHYNKGYGSYLFYLQDGSNVDAAKQCNVYIDSVEIEEAEKIVMPDGVLENFDTPESATRFSVTSSTTAGGTVVGTQPTYVATHTAGGVTKNGVLIVDASKNNGNVYLWAKFTRTVEELKELGITAIKMTYATNGADILRWSTEGSPNLAQSTAWTTVTFDVAKLINPDRAIESFGVDQGNWLLRLATGAGTTMLYIDSIEYEAPEKIVMPEGVLENFDTAESATRFSVKNASGAVSTVNTVSWEESHTAGDVTKNGVLKVYFKDSEDTYLYTNFTRTIAELKALGITKISITYCLAGNYYHISWRGTNDTVKGTLNPSTTWVTGEISIADLETFARFGADKFEETMGSDGVGNGLIRLVASSYNTIYIDEITYS